MSAASHLPGGCRWHESRSAHLVHRGADTMVSTTRVMMTGRPSLLHVSMATCMGGMQKHFRCPVGRRLLQSRLNRLQAPSAAYKPSIMVLCPQVWF